MANVLVTDVVGVLEAVAAVSGGEWWRWRGVAVGVVGVGWMDGLFVEVTPDCGAKTDPGRRHRGKVFGRNRIHHATSPY